MKHIDPETLIRSREAYGRWQPISLAGVKDLVVADPALTPTQRRDLVSALTRVEHLFQVKLERVDATADQIRRLFAKATGIKLEVSDKTLANVRSLVARAIARYSRPVPPVTKRVPLDAEWKALLGRIPTDFQRQGLFRLATYCSAMAITPGHVTRETLIGLHAALEAEELVKSPRGILKSTTANWNRSRRSIPGWPQTELSTPFSTEAFALPLTAFSRAFQNDVARWQERVSNPDPLDEEAPARPLRQTTVEHRIVEFRQFASALVRSGRLPLEEITGLAVLVEPANFKDALRVFLDRTGRTQRVHNLARSMRLIGKHHCHLSDVALETLDRTCRRLDPGDRRRLTEKNR